MFGRKPLLSGSEKSEKTGGASSGLAGGKADGKRKLQCHEKFFFPTIGIMTVLFLISGLVLYPITSQASPMAIHSKLSQERVFAVQQDSGLSSKAKADLVTELPGLTVDINSLKYSMFSGYLTIGKVQGASVDTDKELFYWFIEVEHEDGESTELSPTLLWTNGGPGCSGLVGLLTEHGAFWANSASTLELNDYSWNKYANMLYIEQPYGVGFSEPVEGKIVYGDSDAASDMDSLVREFLTQYSKYESSDFYLSSESFGGHYMPRTSLQILSNNDAGVTPTVNLKGFLVGNPYTDGFENRMGFQEAMFGHGLTSKDVYDDWRSMCYENMPDIGSASCDLIYVKTYLQSMDAQPYALDFPTCELTTPSDAMRLSTRESMGSRTVSSKVSTNGRGAKRALWKQIHSRGIGNVLASRTNEELEITEEQRESLETHLAIGSNDMEYVACGSDYAAAYLNQASVQSALHTKSVGWSMCNYDVNSAWSDEDWNDGMETVYNSLVKDYSIKILVYSGDDDSVCGTPGTQYWLNNMDTWEADSDNDWKEWTYNDELAGFYTKYVTTSDSSLAIHFHTVRSAGHMVPATQPERALELLRMYLYDMESP